MRITTLIWLIVRKKIKIKTIFLYIILCQFRIISLIDPMDEEVMNDPVVQREKETIKVRRLLFYLDFTLTLKCKISFLLNQLLETFCFYYDKLQ